MNTVHHALRTAVRLYATHFPIDRGKGRLIQVLKQQIAQSTVVDAVGLGYRMELDLSEYIQRSIYFFGYYERGLALYFQSLLRPGMVVVDAGANVGQYSLIASQSVGNQGVVYAFEPEPGNFARFSRNLGLNDIQNVRLFRSALDEKAGSATLFLSEEQRAAHNAGGFALRHREDATTAVAEVNVLRLDSVLEETTRFDLMKIDTEGAELNVLRGAAASLARFKPCILLEADDHNTASFGYSTLDIKRFLAELGYSLFRAEEHGRNSVSLVPASLDIKEGYSTLVAFHRERPQTN